MPGDSALFLFSSFMEAPLLSVESLTLLYNNLRSVIPAKAGIQVKKTGFRIKSGMTKGIKTFLRHCIRNAFFVMQLSLYWLDIFYFSNTIRGKSQEKIIG